MSFLIRSIMRAEEVRLRRDGKKKGRQRKLPAGKGRRLNSDVGLGLAETLHAIAGLPEAALLKQVDPLETLQDVAFDDETGDALKAFVL